MEEKLVTNRPMYNCRNYSGYMASSVQTGTPDKIRLMIWDIRYLTGTQLFNDDYSYEPFDVEILKVDIASKEGVLIAEEDTLHVTCEFKCPVELAGVLLLDDPWRTYNVEAKKWDTSLDKDEMYESGWDAYGVYVEQSNIEKVGDVYKANFTLALGNHLNLPQAANSNTTITHELRFRFIGKNGMACPHVPTSIKGPENSLFRNYYKIIAKKLPGVFSPYYVHDIAETYGTWKGAEEE